MEDKIGDKKQMGEILAFIAQLEKQIAHQKTSEQEVEMKEVLGAMKEIEK